MLENKIVLKWCKNHRYFESEILKESCTGSFGSNYQERSTSPTGVGMVRFAQTLSQRNWQIKKYGNKL